MKELPKLLERYNIILTNLLRVTADEENEDEIIKQKGYKDYNSVSKELTRMSNIIREYLEAFLYDLENKQTNMDDDFYSLIIEVNDQLKDIIQVKDFFRRL